MVVSVFQGFIDINIKSLITDYVGRRGGWVFNPGCPWPITCGTELFDNGSFNGVNGAWCDVFFKRGGNFGGGGAFSKNQWGDLTHFTSTGNFQPGFYDIGEGPTISGISTLAQNGAFPTQVNGYQYVIDLNKNSNFPSTLGQTPIEIHAHQIALLPSGTIFPFANVGGTVAMPIDFGFAPALKILARLRNVQYYSQSNEAFRIDSNGVIDDEGSSISFGSLGGISHDGIYSPINRGGTNHLANVSNVPLTEIALTWDDASVNAYMGSSVFTGLSTSTVTPFGWLAYYFGAIPATIFGRTFNQNFLVLTAIDGSKYWIINLVPGDAAAAAAVTGGGSARSGHITPDGTFWYQNSISSDIIFSGVFPLPGLTYVNAIPIDLPYVPRLDEPLY